MLLFFQPRYIQEARMVLKNAGKILAYKRDLLRAEDLREIEILLANLEAAIKARDRQEAEKSAAGLEKIFGKRFPARSDAAWRENCEVFLVAIVIALSIRTYFLQPFTIPTGSMQPTLNGIIGYSTPNDPPPNILKRALDLALLGRTYIDVVANEDEAVEQITEVKRFFFLTYTELACTHGAYLIHAPKDALRACFDIKPGSEYRAGQVIARGYINTGDHVFVDKISYNFRRPIRGEVFVFKTTGIATIEAQLRSQSRSGEEIGSQFYIKRLAGLPGDELRIDPPNLYIDGALASEPGFVRVMQGRGDYAGYSNGAGFAKTRTLSDFAMRPPLLGSPNSTFRLPEKRYFALGDNSYNSSDSRFWGTVPQRNIMGHGLFVYWPFAPHWGLIR